MCFDTMVGNTLSIYCFSLKCHLKMSNHASYESTFTIRKSDVVKRNIF